MDKSDFIKIKCCSSKNTIIKVKKKIKPQNVKSFCNTCIQEKTCIQDFKEHIYTNEKAGRPSF